MIQLGSPLGGPTYNSILILCQGSAVHTQVKNYIAQELTRLGWRVVEDVFTAQTLLGEFEFSNVVATRHHSSPRRLVLGKER